MFVPNNTTWYNETYDGSGDEEYDLYHDYQIPDDVWAVERIILIFIAVFTVLGNTLLLVVIWREKSPHQPNRYFIASRAVADLFVGIFSAPDWFRQLQETEHASESEVWPSEDSCNFIVWMDTFAFTASIYTLTIISYERFLKISKPLKYRTRMTTCASLKIIFIIWIISALLATYAATPHSGSAGIKLSAHVCQYYTTKQFYTFVAVSAFLLPTTIIAIMCTRIFVFVYKRNKLLRNAELCQTSNHPERHVCFSRELQVVPMLFVVVGVFIFCWAPFHIWNLLVFYNVFEWDDHAFSYDILHVVMFALPLCNSLCNPIIHICLDRKCRDSLKVLLQKILCRSSLGRRQQPNETQLRPLRITTTSTENSDLTVN